MSDDSPQHGYLRQAWLVILLALFYGAALAGVQVTLGPRIAENKLNETYEQVPKIVPGAEQTRTVPRTVIGELDGREYSVYQAFSTGGDHVGWVVPASGQGFADRIDVLVGIDAPLETITGLYVLGQKETPGLGNLIEKNEEPDDFCNRFKQLQAEPTIEVFKDEPPPGSNGIRALSGATISSKGVANAVNDALANLKGPMGALPDEPPIEPGVTPSETQQREDD